MQTEKKAVNDSMRGKRYTPEQKQEIIDFVMAHNSEHGRGGQSAAVKKYGLSALTIGNWLKKGGLAGGRGRGTSTLVPAGLTKKVTELVDLLEEIRVAETELEKLRARRTALSTGIRSLI